MTAAARHARPDALGRCVRDLVAAEVRRPRPGQADLQPLPWSDDPALGEDGLPGGRALDSLERMNVEAAFAAALLRLESRVAGEHSTSRR